MSRCAEEARFVSKQELMKSAKDGLDVLPDLQRYAMERTPIEAIPSDDLDRMKWYGVFHRKQTPGLFMLRLRTLGGRLTGEQLRTVVAIAREFGGGTADITTRENLQLRGLTLADIPAALQRLEAAGISTRQSGMDNVRNFIGCPLAGIDVAEVYDTTALIVDLQEALLAARKTFSNLPRKSNVSITGCREDCGQAQNQDLGFLPAVHERDGHRVMGFDVLVGGALGGASPRLATPLDVFVRPEEVVPFFTALLGVYRDHGSREQRTRARLKWLLDGWGEERGPWRRATPRRDREERRDQNAAAVRHPVLSRPALQLARMSGRLVRAACQERNRQAGDDRLVSVRLYRRRF